VRSKGCGSVTDSKKRQRSTLVLRKCTKTSKVINDPSQGRYDGVIAAIGTCGDPKTPHVPGQDKFKGPIYHSSKLDGVSAKGKKVLIIGGGASAIEALDFVHHENAEKAYILARSEKFVILIHLMLPNS
jgi:cation diffusion facilitator CzcD-associated flavoprotein CzcO